MTSSISVFGLGYVGTVTAACLASKGRSVLGVDVNPTKVKTLDSGASPILEPQVAELIAQGHRECRLHATTDTDDAIQRSAISIICVGTPSQRNGSLDLSSVERVCHSIGLALRRKPAFHLVVVRSTVVPGTTESKVIPALEAASQKKAGQDFGVCFNPEFLREGTAVADFFEPALTVLGAAEPRALTPLRELYAWVPGRVFETSLAAAEMVKYVCNAFHALKVGFANEVGALCKQLNVDAHAVMEIFTSDGRLNISAAYLKPGFAFGGSCLPKDLRAITYRAKQLDVKLPLIESILASNQEHLERAVEAILHTGKKTIGLLGLSFKPGTDDLRESPLVHLVKRLLGEGCQVQIWDPHVSLGHLVGSNRQFIEDEIPHIGKLLRPTAEEVLRCADVVVIGTKAVDKKTLAACLSAGQHVFDLVNLEKDRRLDGQANYAGICW